MGTYAGQSISVFLLLLIVGGLPSGIRSMMTGHANTDFGGEASRLLYTATTAASAARMAMALAPGAGAAAQAVGAAASAGGGAGGAWQWNPNASGGGGGGPRMTAALLSDSNMKRLR